MGFVGGPGYRELPTSSYIDEPVKHSEVCLFFISKLSMILELFRALDRLIFLLHQGDEVAWRGRSRLRQVDLRFVFPILYACVVRLQHRRLLQLEWTVSHGSFFSLPTPNKLASVVLKCVSLCELFIIS